jgi:acyl carrier protein
METLRNQVQEVFRDVFGNDELTLTDEMTADDVDGWDSLAHLNLIIAIEKRFGIKFANAEISNLKEPGKNMSSLLEAIGNKLPGT